MSPRTHATLSHGDVSALPAKIRALLDHDRSVVGPEQLTADVLSFCLSALQHGWTERELVAVLVDSSYPLTAWATERDEAGDVGRPRSLAHAERKVRKTVAAARNRLAAAPSGLQSADQRLVLAELRAVLADTSWTGSSATANALLYAALLNEADRIGSTTVSPSVRSLSVTTGLSKSAVSRGLHRLAAAGWLVPATSTKACDQTASSAALWTLVPASELVHGVVQSGTPSFTLPWGENTVSRCAHDLFSAKGLGRSAGLVFAALLGGDLSASELTDMLPLHRTTVSRALAKLAEWPVAVEKEGRWFLVETDLDVLLAEHDEWERLHSAEPQLASGTAARRAERYAADRAHRAAVLRCKTPASQPARVKALFGWLSPSHPELTMTDDDQGLLVRDRLTGYPVPERHLAELVLGRAA